MWNELHQCKVVVVVRIEVSNHFPELVFHLNRAENGKEVGLETRRNLRRLTVMDGRDYVQRAHWAYQDPTHHRSIHHFRRSSSQKAKRNERLVTGRFAVPSPNMEVGQHGCVPRVFLACSLHAGSPAPVIFPSVFTYLQLLPSNLCLETKK